MINARPLVSAELRRPVAAAAGAAAVVFTALAVRYAGTTGVSTVDATVRALVSRPDAAHRWLVVHTMRVGSPSSVLALSALLAGACLLLGRRRLAALAVVGPGVTGAGTTVLKPLLGRTIDGGFAFPSGHTAGATALGLVTGLLLVSVFRLGRAGALLVIATSGLAAGSAVAAALISWKSHYPTDTVGGLCAAVVLVFTSAFALDRLAGGTLVTASRVGRPEVGRATTRRQVAVTLLASATVLVLLAGISVIAAA